MKSGVYKGFSVGGSTTKRDDLNKTIITGLNLVEISLVDRPCNPNAVITCYKADGMGEPHKGEVVFSQSDIAWLGGMNAVESMRKGNLNPFTQQNQIEAHVQQAKIQNNISPGDVSVSNFNYIDPVQMLKHALATPSGTKVLMNNMSENSTQIGRMVR